MRFIKILIATLLIFSTLSFMSVEQADANSGITIYVDGKKQVYSNKAIIQNGSTLVPLRGIFEALGAEVKWNQSTKTIDAKKGNTNIWLKIGSKATKVNGKIVNIDISAQVVKGNTLVPLRFISEALGAEVKWNQTTKTITITSANNSEGDVVTDPISKKKMKVHFIDVGQGDSTFIELATGENVLVDAGTDAAGDKVVSYLKSLGITTIDYLIATHPDADHIGGMVDVMDAFKVLNFIDSGKEHTSATYERMLEAIIEEKATYEVPEYGQVYEYDEKLESYFQVLHVNENAQDNNDASLVIKGGYCNQDFLVMGDASTEIEAELMKNYDNLEVAILKAGHHGSNTSSSIGFLKAINPEAVILSYGKDNSYGHPHREVLDNIKNVGAKAYSTATEGTIAVTVDCNGYEIDAIEFEFDNDPNSGLYVVPNAPTVYSNCSALREVYPNGVKTGHPAYATKLDSDGDGWACEPYDDGELKPTPTPTPTPTPNKSYKNCSELRKDFPNGVSSSHWAYQKKMDRDGDGWACE